MGMDVYGDNPTSDLGRHLRQSVWGWSPLWKLTCDLGGIGDDLRFAGKFNQGAGLDGDGSARLAHTLFGALDGGAVADWIARHEEALAALPPEPCQWCGATGVRRDAVGVDMGMDVAGTCNGCNGTGYRPHPATHCSTSEDEVVEWARFLADCGGFKIH